MTGTKRATIKTEVLKMPYDEPIGNGAMWDKVSNKGNEFLSGTMEFSASPGTAPVKVSFVAFRNGQKQTDKSPDYRILVNSCVPAPARAAAQARNAPSLKAFGSANDSDEDIPF
jgi:uncharacterized protein (DUF736 family)